jgi:7-cyano-7-deazaguanine synthase
VRSGLFWQAAELHALKRFLVAIASSRLEPLVCFELPLDDLYSGHWSITGRDVPGSDTPDEAVFLPGRNALLALKPALWCQMHGIGRLALGTLGSNPFGDATSGFFHDLEGALNRGSVAPIEFLRPFETFDKRRVMELGRRYPLQTTFSCIDPVENLHCGRCNKCAERRVAFGLIALADPTQYAN